MKVIYFTILTIWILHIETTSAEYRYKMRGPPPPPARPPPMPQYYKKFHGQPPLPYMQRGPMRPRPIPHIHMNPTIPKINLNGPTIKRPLPPPVSLPVAAPVRNIWKQPQNSFPTHQEKPFISSPAVPKTEYDFHIQTNSIPHHINSIKQVDEKGPIHTIPAPKLSPADKPKIIEEVHSHTQPHPHLQAHLQPQPHLQPQVHLQPQAHLQSQSHLQPQSHLQSQPHLQPQSHLVPELQEPSHTIVQIQKAHQYQVTEPSELHHAKPLYQQDEVLDFEKILNQQELNQNIKLSSNAFSQPQLFSNGQDQISPQELFKLLNAYPQQQQLLDTYPLPLLQQPQLQQHLTQQQGPQQSLATSPQLYEQQVSYITQIQHDVDSNEKLHIQPEFHSFNYEEQGQKSQSRIDTLDDDEFVSEASEKRGDSRNPLEALAQAQYVQHFFDTRDNNLARNNIEPDAKPSPQTIYEDPEEDTFYTTLPSRKAAEALASLQEAGKINTKNRQQSPTKTYSHKAPITIYVPDENEADETNKESPHDDLTQSEQFQDYDDDADKENEKSDKMRSRMKHSYGSRLKPKNN